VVSSPGVVNQANVTRTSGKRLVGIRTTLAENDVMLPLQLLPNATLSDRDVILMKLALVDGDQPQVQSLLVTIVMVFGKTKFDVNLILSARLLQLFQEAAVLIVTVKCLTWTLITTSVTSTVQRITRQHVTKSMPISLPAKSVKLRLLVPLVVGVLTGEMRVKKQQSK
jgi:predicted ABC-type sugar transport system permease subunit